MREQQQEMLHPALGFLTHPIAIGHNQKKNTERVTTSENNNNEEPNNPRHHRQTQTKARNKAPHDQKQTQPYHHIKCPYQN